MKNFGLDSKELSILRRLNSPAKIQDFLENELAYNLEKHGETCYSPKLVLRYGRAHCMEGALFAAAALRINGQPPLILDMQAVDDDDHVIAVYKIKKCWGAIAQSKFSGLKFREAVYSNIRELAMSYFEHYYDFDGRKTLRHFSMPINLARFDKKNWMISEKSLEYIAKYIDKVKHYDITMPGKRLRNIGPYRLKTEVMIKP